MESPCEYGSEPPGSLNHGVGVMKLGLEKPWPLTLHVILIWGELYEIYALNGLVNIGATFYRLKLQILNKTYSWGSIT